MNDDAPIEAGCQRLALNVGSPQRTQSFDIKRAHPTQQLLQTTLWPGWGWGSFRWALAYHVLLSLVLYPLCVLGAGLWALTRQRRSARGAGRIEESSSL
jgi:hypothetical protein